MRCGVEHSSLRKADKVSAVRREKRVHLQMCPELIPDFGGKNQSHSQLLSPSHYSYRYHTSVEQITMLTKFSLFECLRILLRWMSANQVIVITNRRKFRRHPGFMKLDFTYFYMLHLFSTFGIFFSRI